MEEDFLDKYYDAQVRFDEALFTTKDFLEAAVRKLQVFTYLTNVIDEAMMEADESVQKAEEISAEIEKFRDAAMEVDASINKKMLSLVEKAKSMSPESVEDINENLKYADKGE